MKRIAAVLAAALLWSVLADAQTWYLCGTEIPKTQLQSMSSTSLCYDNSKLTLKGRIWFESSANSCFGRNADQYLKIDGSPTTYQTTSGTRAPIVVDGEIQTTNICLNVSTGELQVWGSPVPNTDYQAVEFAVEDLANPTYFTLEPVEGSADTYSGSVTLSGTTNFRIRAGEYLYGTGSGNENVELNHRYSIARNGGYFTVGEGTHIFRVTLGRDAESGYIQEVEENYSEEPLDLVLTIGDSEYGTSMKRDNLRANIYTAVADVTADNTELQIHNGETLLASETVDAGLYRVGAVMAGETATMDILAIPMELYAVNTFAALTFDFENPMPLDGTARDGLFTASGVDVKQGGETFFATCTGEFAVVKASVRYGAQTNQTPVNPQNQEPDILPLATVEGGQNVNTFKITNAGKYDLTVDFSGYTPVFSVADPNQQTSISTLGVAVQDDTVTYFDTLGRMVENPSPGLYLERTSSGVRKVYIR